MSPHISVVIPTYARADLLPRVLGALADQVDAPEFEVVVVDDGSPDCTAEVVASFPRVRYLRQTNAGPAAARNRGWRAASAPVVAFTDDDTVPDPHWLRDLAAAFADPGVAAVGGTIRPLVDTPMAQFVEAERHVDHGRMLEDGPDYLVTANAAFRRDVLDDAGGFDEGFTGASGEDVDLSWRVRARGGRLARIDGALVLHDHRTSIRQVIRTFRRHGASRVELRRRHPAEPLGAAASRAMSPTALACRWGRYRALGASRLRAAGFLLLHLVGIGAYGAGLVAARRASPRNDARPARVVVACSGLGHVERGYERSSRELAALLRADSGLQVELAGGARSPGIHRLPSLRRTRPAARWLARVSGRRSETGPHDGRRAGVQGHTALAAFVRGRLPIDPYEVEQVAFGIALCAYLIRTRPNVLVLHDVLVAKVVARLPRRLRPAVVFVNGAPWPAPYPFADVVEHVTEPSRVEALRAGGDPERNLVVPCLVPVVGPPTCTERSDARRRLGVPMDARLVVSVGALNLHHKRHDHLIDEVARLEHDGLHLLIAGAADPEADLVRALAAERLADRATVVTVQPEEIATVYQAADVFALASLVEGFGLAAAEAASAGLPVIVHDGPVQRWVLGGSAAYVDMRVEGQLASSLCAVLSGDCAAPGQQVQQRFGPDALRTEHRAAIDRALELRGAR